MQMIQTIFGANKHSESHVKLFLSFMFNILLIVHLFLKNTFK